MSAPVLAAWLAHRRGAPPLLRALAGGWDLEDLDVASLLRLSSCRDALALTRGRRARALDVLVGALDVEARATRALRDRALSPPERLDALAGALGEGGPGPSGDAVDALLEIESARVAARVGGGAWRGTTSGDLAQTRPADCGVVARLVPPGGHLVDLGSGLGRLGFVLAALDPTARYTGVEIEVARVAEARRAAAALGVDDRVTFVEGDLASAEVPEGDVYYAFLPFPAATATRVLGLLREREPLRLVLQGSWPDVDLSWLVAEPAPPPLRSYRA